ncbi:MAG: glycosyltransferase [Xanthomonadales bacterium]|nr:glycosyltransferase [Xanthomonadales bacterium]
MLFIDYEVPRYDLYAGSRTNFMYLEMLAGMGLEVKFLPADFQRAEPYSTELNELGIETLDGEWFRDHWQSWLADNGQAIDYVFIHKPDPAEKFLAAIKRHTDAAIIYQCHDLHYLRLRRKAEVENDKAALEEARNYEQKEDFIFRNSDVLLTFSGVEEKIIRAKFPRKQVFTVPLFFYNEALDPVRDFSKRQGLLFIGACAHTPNRDAISWFCKEIFPFIRQQVPDVFINVVGADPAEDILALNSKHIRVLGRVSEAELQALYADSRMMVVPLRFGAGVKGKVIEALHNGMPLVSTAIGLEGIRGIEEIAVPRDKAEEFAAAVASLYTDEQKLRELSSLGSKFVEQHFTTAKTAQRMAEILDVADKESALRRAGAGADAAEQAAPRLIALYLPQFHPIPENDEWWGEGFTEWRNVSKAKPLFDGHYQPHVPADLGYYDLREKETQLAQAELAKKYGIEGFCYYHYWFKGRRLLELPLQEVLESGEPGLPFCICWANENWTRRWDGEEHQILMKQEYSEEDDRLHIQSLLPVFEDERYIRVDGKPLFLVYRTENLPDPARTAEIWREEAHKAGLGELYLVRVESISKSDPREINFDAGLEFAPDWWNKGPQLKADPEAAGHPGGKLAEICNDNWIHSYQGLAEAMMDKDVPPYKWFRCVTPSWDNWARRKDGANIFLDSTPEKYGAWLSQAIDDSNGRLLGEERLVFINAWNEWAEGNHLEPDERWGHGYLRATRRALEENAIALESRRAGASDDAKMGHYMSQLLNDDQPSGYPEDQRLQKLEKKVSRRDEVIADMLNSTSWRVSAPIRWLKQSLVQIRKRFSG